MSKNIDDLIKNLRSAADQLDSIKDSASDEDIKKVIENNVEPMSCCGTCTGVPPIPPCENTCVSLPPFM
ncbi:hypothetical protein [Clostridium cellulovorans]|uniref:Uncharacterized protein n=1 Tax=Clostridium cellulovorans (strain ATCC 35296 / DSM 3052 / OCM 3 / 743B) TaxID=573061 RepID=D9ST91_CLOC7|nr:hypothetical protein [Clostridium cellulovorans]ADL50707.1 hypothetical protein Clocel_0939 [Clostridium cellulovorans 743B]